MSKFHGSSAQERKSSTGRRSIIIEATVGCPAFCCLLGCIWTWRGVLFFLCALMLHEWGHALVLALLHVPVRRIRFGFGDIEMETLLLGYREELLSAWAGPAVNLALWLAMRRTVPTFAAVNLLLGIYNLLPVLPLDGGRALSAALNLLLEERLAVRISFGVSLLVAVCLLGLSLTMVRKTGLLPLAFALALYARLAFLEKNIAFRGGRGYNTL